MHRSRLAAAWTLAALLCAAVPAPIFAAQTEAEAIQSEALGVFRGPDFRYDRMDLVPRTFYDLAAVPASVAWWDAWDWTTFGVFTGATLGLMWPSNPSPDTLIDRWATDYMDPWFPDIWAMKYQVFLWGGLVIGGLGTWGASWAFGWPRAAETCSLMLEALAISQFWHLTFKMILGREGPQNGDGLGLVLGPTKSFSLFPAGTPSGHFATLYTLFAVITEYWRPHPLWVGLGHAILAFGGLTHVLTHRHFMSDLVWGIGIGQMVGMWVVQHRSTRYREVADGEASRVVVVPMAGKDTGGIVVGWSF